MKRTEPEKLVIELQEQIRILQQKNKILWELVNKLKRQLGINSNTSSKPPSSDGLSEPKASARINSLREKI